MISSVSPQFGIGVLTQTSSFLGFSSSLGSIRLPETALQPSSATFEPNAMVQQISSQVQSSKSATEALQQVYQTLTQAEDVLSSNSSDESIQGEIKLLYNGLVEVQEGLAELEGDVGSAAADKRIFRQMESAVDQSVKSVGQILENPQNSTPLKSAQASVLSSIGRMEELSQNLEKASLNVLKISSAYVPFQGNSGTDLTSLYGLSTSFQATNLGLALDQVS